MSAQAIFAERPSRAAADVIDLAHLVRQTLGDSVLEREILQLFARQATSLVVSIEAPAQADKRAMAAHTLKGSARAIGAWRVAEAAERAETSGEATVTASLRRAVEEANAAIALLLS